MNLSVMIYVSNNYVLIFPDSKEWHRLQIKGESIGELAFHQCAAVYRKERYLNNAFGLFKQPEI